MALQISLGPLLAVAAGIVILIKPKLLNYVVGVYLVADGVLRLLGRRV